MKKLGIILLMLIVGVIGYSQVSILKIGNTLKFTGLTAKNTSLPTLGGILYLSAVDVVGGYSGDVITFSRSVDPTYPALKIPFADITDKLGQANVAAYIHYLANNGYFSVEVTIAGSSGLGLVVDTISKRVNVQLKDGTRQATIGTRGSTTSLNTTIIDASGNVVSAFGGADVDKSSFSLGSDKGTTMFGVYSSDAVTAGQKAALGMTASRQLKVYPDSTAQRSLVTITGTVAHGVNDAGNPVKIGGRAIITRPTAVAANQRVNAAFDELGRQHVVDDGAYVQANYFPGCITAHGTVVFTTDTTITITGGPMVYDATNSYVSWIKYRGSAATAQWKTIRNGSFSSIDVSAGVVTVRGFPVGNKPFVTGDTYQIGILSAPQTVDQTTNSMMINSLTPESARYYDEILVDSTNVGAAATVTYYLPSTTGYVIEGYKDVAIEMKTLGGVTTTIEAHLDGSASPDWIDITKVCLSMTNNTLGSASYADVTDILSLSNINLKAIRIKRVTTDMSNTSKYTIKLKAL